MKTSYTRIFIGLSILLFGGLLLLESLNINGFDNVLGIWWPLFIIGLGVGSLLSNFRTYLWALLIIGAGVVYLLRNLGVTDLDPLVWPALIIVLGLSVIFRRPGMDHKLTKQQSDDVSAILGGVDHVNTSEDYKGGKITAIMGGVKIDLRKAVIKDEATLDVFALMGGVELIVPENVVVKSKAMVILGGIENKAQTTADKKSPTLYITGEIFMGGVEVKI